MSRPCEKWSMRPTMTTPRSLPPPQHEPHARHAEPLRQRPCALTRRKRWTLGNQTHRHRHHCLNRLCLAELGGRGAPERGGPDARNWQLGRWDDWLLCCSWAARARRLVEPSPRRMSALKPLTIQLRWSAVLPARLDARNCLRWVAVPCRAVRRDEQQWRSVRRR